MRCVNFILEYTYIHGSIPRRCKMYIYLWVYWTCRLCWYDILI